MLILTRRAGEAILIDGDIRIVVLAVDSRGVRIGIQAPSDVGVVREEVAERIAAENRRAGLSPEARRWLDELDQAEPPSPGAPDEE
jgi:carbon storage regulator